MSTLVIKNLPEALHARLKEQAECNRRSVTKEVVTLIETGLKVGRAPAPLPPLVKLRGGRNATIATFCFGHDSGRLRGGKASWKPPSRRGRSSRPLSATGDRRREAASGGPASYPVIARRLAFLMTLVPVNVG